MAKKNQQRILTILGGIVGAALTAVGIRQGVQWYQRRMRSRRNDMDRTANAWPAERRYQPIDQPDRRPIPATGPAPAAMPMTAAERVNSDRVSDFDDRGTAFTTAEMETNKDTAMTGDDSPVARAAANDMGTGMGSQPISTEPYPSGQSSDIVMDDFVAPLIEHAIAFNSVINLLRSRQREGAGFEGTESLTQGDRNSMRAVLDQMQQLKGDYNEADLRKDPLAQRSYNLTHKLREALDNIDYTGADLFRINGEIRTELCSLSKELEASHKVTITGLDHIRQLYECE